MTTPAKADCLDDAAQVLADEWQALCLADAPAAAARLAGIRERERDKPAA